MRQLIVFTLLMYSTLAFGQNDPVSKIRFDGLYQSDIEINLEDNDTIWQYIRFYPDGQVISVATEGTPTEITKWFKLDFEGVSKGKFKFKKERLSFSTTSKSGTVDYKGKIIDRQNLLLRTKSHINGYKATEKYYFIKVNDLK